MRQRRRGLCVVIAVEEIGDVNHQGTTDFEQAACADAVGAGLVFLDLLVGNLQRAAEIFLGQPEFGAAFADAFADMKVCALPVR